MPHVVVTRPTAFALVVLAALSLAPCTGTAQVVTPVTTSLGIDATANNTSPEPGITRNLDGNGPIADSAAVLSGLSFATAAAAIDAGGLHMVATVQSSAGNPYATASARAFGGLVDPFILVPRAGFTGSMAWLQIPYSFSGTVNHYPSLASCSTCAAAVQADLGVDGMGDAFHFLGGSSQGSMSNPTFFLGGVAKSGVLEGWVPVNTELYLRAGLLTQVHCQSNESLTCGSEALFGGTLSFFGHSPDAVDIVWGLAPNPVAAVPEPSMFVLLAAGLAGMARLGRRRGRAD